MSAVRRLAVAAATLMLSAACTSGAPGGGAGDPPPEDSASAATEATDEFLTALAAGDTTAAAALTDRRAPARQLLDQLTEALSITATSYQLGGDPRGDPQCDDAGCHQPVELTHELAGIGPWTYDTTVTTRESGDGEWRVRWRPATFHPALTGATTLTRERELPLRASILDREGRRLTRNGQVRRVGVVAGKVEPSTYADLVRLLDIDPGALRSSVEAASPAWFVPVITLREADYRPLSRRLLRVPGISVDSDVWSLTPSPSWGRALLGTVGPATEETLAAAGPYASATDVVGASGLQLAFEEQLAGVPGGRVVLADAESGADLRTLVRSRPQPGEPLRTTLDHDVQGAAERAVGAASKLTALVAVEASTGNVLASAVGPGIQSYNTAFVGQYPPGSTFKVVSSAVLLEAGIVGLTEPASCPETFTVDGKSFKNYDDLEPLPDDAAFVDAFAASCNTAVVSHAKEISDQAMQQMATRMGLGGEWSLGVASFSGDVPVAESVVDRAASMIGQGRVLTSPLAMAMVAAAVDSGTPRVPRLVEGEPVEAAALGPLPGALAGDLRAMMRATVTRGTASALDLPGEPVFAKTGTAEYDSDDPSKTHAWMIGFRGDLAFAVLVDNGSSGSEDAAPVLRDFLQRLS